MGPYLQLSTYSQDFRSPGHTKPSQARPTSSHRRNKPHVRPDFLLPRKPQTAYGGRLIFPKIGPADTAPLFPPVRHAFMQYPDGKRSQKQSELNPVPISKAERSGVAMPPAGCLPKPQSDDTNYHGPFRNLQGEFRGRSINPAGSPLSKRMDPTLRPFKSQGKYYTPNPQSPLISSGGYSCFQVVKPYKAGYYIIHPEFISESQH